MSQYQNSTNSFACGYNSTQGWYFNYANNAAEVINTRAGTSPLNTWTHVAFVKSSTTMTVYVNGTALASTITVPNLPLLSSTLNIGIWAGALDSLWNGYISNLRMVKGTAVYTGNFTPSTTPLTAVANTSLLTCQSNRLIDNSTNNFTITKNGDTRVERFSPFSPGAAYSSSTIGGSAYFDGSGDSLQAPSGASISGTGDFTAECWIYPTTVPGTYNVIACSDTTGGLTMFGLNANGTIFMGRSLIDVQATTSNSLRYNTWNHIAVSRSSGTVRLFINGVQGYSGSITTNYNAGTVRFGTDGGGSALPYTGYISNFRIITNSAIYTSNFTPPTAPVTAISGTSLLLNHTNGGIIDSAMINNLETLGNAKISTTQSKFGGSSMYFDGTGDNLYSPTSINYNCGTGNFTVEAWVYISSYPGSYPLIIGNNNGSWSAGAIAFTAQNSTSGGANKISVAVYDINSSAVTLAASSTNSFNTWYHVAVVRNGTNLSLYRDGTSVASATISSAVVFDWGKTGSLVGGGNWDGAAGYFNGYIDDLRVTKGYARYTTTFTPPTAELPNQ